MNLRDYGPCGKALEDARDETGWNDDSLVIQLLRFLAIERQRDTDIDERFQQFLNAVVTEELELLGSETDIDDNEEDDDGTGWP